MPIIDAIDLYQDACDNGYAIYVDRGRPAAGRVPPADPVVIHPDLDELAGEVEKYLDMIPLVILRGGPRLARGQAHP